MLKAFLSDVPKITKPTSHKFIDYFPHFHLYSFSLQNQPNKHKVMTVALSSLPSDLGNHLMNNPKVL